MALKANILFGKIAASDQKNHSLKKDAAGNYLWDYQNRGLSFSSPITEISVQLEINFFNLYTQSHKNTVTKIIKNYV